MWSACKAGSLRSTSGSTAVHGFGSINNRRHGGGVADKRCGELVPGIRRSRGGGGKQLRGSIRDLNGVRVDVFKTRRRSSVLVFQDNQLELEQSE